MKKIVKSGALCAAILASATLSGCGNRDQVNTSDHTTEVHAKKWRLTSTFPSTLLQIGTLGKTVTKEIYTVSNGSVDIKFHEPGVLAPPFETFDAVSYGAIEAGWATSGYWAGKEPALQLFASVPFGPAAPEYLAWYDYGGGKELFEEIYKPHNIHPIICGLTPPEAAGWYKKPINSADDFKGLKIRFFGLGGKVLEKLGASPQLIAGGEIYQALELGTIDGSEYAMPAVDEKMGFYEVAKHYYFPGWHQQSTFYELIINLDAWNSLSQTQQKQIEMACAANVRYGISQGEAMQSDALKRLEEKGVTIHQFDDVTLDRLETAWQDVVQDIIASDKNFARTWNSLQDFRSKYKSWSRLGYLKPKHNQD